MSGSRAGGRKTAETIKKKYGPDYYKKIGHAGGSTYDRATSPPRGFAALSPERRAEISRKGGAIGGRAPKKKKDER